MIKRIISFMVIILLIVSTTCFAITLDEANTYVGSKVTLVSDMGIFGSRSFVGEVIEILTTTYEDGSPTQHCLVIQEKDTFKLSIVDIDYITVIKKIDY